MNWMMKGFICLSLLLLAIGLDLILKVHDVHLVIHLATGSRPGSVMYNISCSIWDMVCCIKWFAFTLSVVSLGRIGINKSPSMLRLTFLLLTILFILLQFVFV